MLNNPNNGVTGFDQMQEQMKQMLSQVQGQVQQGLEEAQRQAKQMLAANQIQMPSNALKLPGFPAIPMDKSISFSGEITTQMPHGTSTTRLSVHID